MKILLVVAAFLVLALKEEVMGQCVKTTAEGACTAETATATSSCSAKKIYLTCLLDPAKGTCGANDPDYMTILGALMNDNCKATGECLGTAIKTKCTPEATASSSCSARKIYLDCWVTKGCAIGDADYMTLKTTTLVNTDCTATGQCLGTAIKTKCTPEATKDSPCSARKTYLDCWVEKGCATADADYMTLETTTLKNADCTATGQCLGTAIKTKCTPEATKDSPCSARKTYLDCWVEKGCDTADTDYDTLKTTTLKNADCTANGQCKADPVKLACTVKLANSTDDCDKQKTYLDCLVEKGCGTTDAAYTAIKTTLTYDAKCSGVSFFLSSTLAIAMLVASKMFSN